MNNLHFVSEILKNFNMVLIANLRKHVVHKQNIQKIAIYLQCLPLCYGFAMSQHNCTKCKQYFNSPPA